jgi:cytochrome c553
MNHAIALLIAALISAPALAAEGNPAAGTAPKADLAKGQATAATCMACHLADGSRGAPANPILAGQHPEYLAKQLHDFKSGKRKNAIMQGMAAPLSEEDIRNVAAFYAGKQAKPGAATNKDTVLLGQKIWRGGIADRKIPACAGCHGPTGAGIPVQYPKLSGQHAAYTEAQLLGFRSGERGNNPTMTMVAAKMNDTEIKAVADYIAGLR